ncbi:MAG: protein kinase [Saprospiraceae bacterium]|nr:protein kinase [Saprospiraceae bacterium]
MIGTKINGWTIIPFTDENGVTTDYVGKGGMATVYYAENSIHKKAAVKVMHRRYMDDDKVQQRFRQEAEAMVMLNHRHIKDVYDLVLTADFAAIVMEYLDGYDLKQYSEKFGPLPEAKATDWLRQALDALSFAHKKKVLHRDIKPSNLFVTRDGVLKMVDFGIAKIIDADSELTATDQIVGTPMYMSPEQIVSPRDLDPRTDIYSLGVTFYSLLSGKPPYDRNSTSAINIQYKIVHEELPALTNISPEMRAIIQKAIKKDRYERYGSCEEFLYDLENIGKVKLYCPNPRCKRQLPGNSSFCSHCGSHKDTRFCTNIKCLTEVSSNAHFCKKCGTHL